MSRRRLSIRERARRRSSCLRFLGAWGVLCVWVLACVAAGQAATSGAGPSVPFPHAGLLVFSCSGCPGAETDSRLFTVRPDGRRLRVLEGTAGLYEPRWSPDGRRLALSSGFREIWVADASGANSRQVTPPADAAHGINDQSPAWFPDGKRLVYVRSVPPTLGAGTTNRTALWTVPLTGQIRKRLLAPPLSAGPPDHVNVVDPEVSHDGRWVAFNDVSEQMWLVRADGSGRRRLGAADLTGREPHWSPDDTHVVFLDIDADPALRILDVATGRVRTVRTSATALAASWSPDGYWLAVAETRDYQCDDPTGPCQDLELWITNPTGTRSRMIYRSPYGEIYGLDWRPL